MAFEDWLGCSLETVGEEVLNVRGCLQYQSTNKCSVCRSPMGGQASGLVKDRNGLLLFGCRALWLLSGRKNSLGSWMFRKYAEVLENYNYALREVDTVTQF